MKVLLLAGGKNSRFWPINEDETSNMRHKSTVKIMGKPIIVWTIENLTKIGLKDFIVIQHPNKNVEKTIKSYNLNANINYLTQKEPLGMGDALMKAEKLVDDYFLVINPNHFDAHKIAEVLLEKIKEKKVDLVLAGRKTEEPWNYGIFILDENNNPKGLVEKPEKGKEPSNIKIVGIYLLSKKFFDYHRKLKLQQYSFEEALNNMLKNEKAELITINEETPTLKYTWHLLDTAEKIMNNFCTRSISKSAQIDETAKIIGNVTIEDNVHILENAVIKGPSYIGKNTIIGNNVLIRESVIGDDVLIGANSEVARSIFFDGVHIHSGFFGDTILCENVRVGAGTIFANVRMDRDTIKVNVKNKKIDTKKRRFGGVVGANTKIGVNCSIMPGKHIGSNSVIGPNTLINENVPSNTRYYTKFEKVIKNDKSNYI